MIYNRRVIFFRSAYPWLIVSCGMLFYCYNYFLRVSPSVMQEALTQSFHINASQFGMLAAFYYYAYTPMQIPAGLLYDKFGARFVLAAASLTSVVGLIFFILATNFYMAGLGRFMIGLGSAFAYIGTLKLASIWLPENRFATVAGLTTAVGMASGALAQKYLTHIIESIGYHAALQNALIAGALLSLILFSIVRNHPHQAPTTSTASQPMSLKQVLRALRVAFMNPQMWLIGIIGCLLYLPSSVFLDLWGIPFLKTVYGLTSAQAVNIANFMFYGWILSGPIIGVFSDKIRRRKLPLTTTGLIAAILLCLIFYIPDFSISTLYVICFMIGFCCGGHPLTFALSKESNPIAISGTSVAITNMLIMAGGAIFQPLVGKLLDLHAEGAVNAQGLPIYNASDYLFALSVIPIGVAIGIFLSLFLKETYCECQAKESDENVLASSLEEVSERAAQ